MPDLTKSQERAIEELHEVFIGATGRVVEVAESGAVIYEIPGKGRFEIGKRGKQTMLEGADSAVVSPVPETVVAAEPSVEDATVQTSGEVSAGERGASVPECAPGGKELPGAKTSGEDGGSGNGPALSGEVNEVAPVGLVDEASSPVEVSDEVSDPGNGSQGPLAPIDPSQNGEGTAAAGVDETSARLRPSPDTSVEPVPQNDQPAPDAAASENEVAAGQDSADPSLPTGSVEPVPTFDQLPQVRRAEAYEAMSRADELQISAEIEGNAVNAMVYGFDGKYGLSWVGVREAVRQINTRGMGEIRISDQSPPLFEDVTVLTEVGWDPESKKPIKEERPAIRCTVYGMDAQHGSGQWGTATVPRDQISKKGPRDGHYYKTTPDGFAANKALSKAQRNAMEPLVPREIIENLIALKKGEGAIQYLQGTGREVAVERPAALTDDRAKAQMDRCREIYGEIKKIDGWQKEMPPALFNRSMEACQHDHDRLDDFIAHLEGLLAQGQGSDG